MQEECETGLYASFSIYQNIRPPGPHTSNWILQTEKIEFCKFLAYNPKLYILIDYLCIKNLGRSCYYCFNNHRLMRFLLNVLNGRMVNYFLWTKWMIHALLRRKPLYKGHIMVTLTNIDQKVSKTLYAILHSMIYIWTYGMFMFWDFLLFGNLCF